MLFHDCVNTMLYLISLHFLPTLSHKNQLFLAFWMRMFVFEGIWPLFWVVEINVLHFDILHGIMNIMDMPLNRSLSAN